MLSQNKHLFKQVDNLIIPKVPKRGRPFVYSIKTMIKCFLIQLIKRLDSVRALWEFFKTKGKEALYYLELCGLESIPDRRTFDRRLTTLTKHIREYIQAIGRLIIEKKLTNAKKLAADSSLMEAMTKITYSPKTKRAKITSLDPEARWGYSDTKGLIPGYKLHLLCTADLKTPVPIDIVVTPANRTDNKVLPELLPSLPEETEVIIADKGYDDKKLRRLVKKQGKELITPVNKRNWKKELPKKLKERIVFLKSKIGRTLYCLRSETIEPLIGQIKNIFHLNKLRVKGLLKVQVLTYLSVLFYQGAILTNHLTGNPLRKVKYLLV